jgi:hypothetical protein
MLERYFEKNNGQDQLLAPIVNQDSDIDSGFISLTCIMQFLLRPEGPPVNRPGRKAGNVENYKMSAEGAALHVQFCAAPSALEPLNHLFPALRPGLLTGGPSGLNSQPQGLFF